MPNCKSAISKKIKFGELKEAARMAPADKLRHALELSSFALKLNLATRKVHHAGNRRKS